jgi:hypothetical protein
MSCYNMATSYLDTDKDSTLTITITHLCLQTYTQMALQCLKINLITFSTIQDFI